MGTIAELAVVGRSEVRAHRALDEAVAELRRVEALMTWFRDDSDVGRANVRGGAGRPVAISSETAEVLREALAWARASGGAFDPCLGRSVRIWDVAHRREPPPASDVTELAGRALWTHLEVETSGTVPRVTYHDPRISLDLGGIAKGYGVDAAANALRDQGIFRGLVNVGGDLVAMGASEDGDPWEIGVRSPEDPGRMVARLRLADGALATSGDYLNYFDHRGRRYHHLLDPASGEPRRSRMHTLTVSARRCMTADAGATAVFGMGRERGGAVLQAAYADARIAHTDGG
jgi:thiamine biosynthesis lipoprotein